MNGDFPASFVANEHLKIAEKMFVAILCLSYQVCHFLVAYIFLSSDTRSTLEL